MELRIKESPFKKPPVLLRHEYRADIPPPEPRNYKPRISPHTLNELLNGEHPLTFILKPDAPTPLLHAIGLLKFAVMKYKDIDEYTVSRYLKEKASKMGSVPVSVLLAAGRVSTGIPSTDKQLTALNRLGILLYNGKYNVGRHILASKKQIKLGDKHLNNIISDVLDNVYDLARYLKISSSPHRKKGGLYVGMLKRLYTYKSERDMKVPTKLLFHWIDLINGFDATASHYGLTTTYYYHQNDKHPEKTVKTLLDLSDPHIAEELTSVSDLVKAFSVAVRYPKLFSYYKKLVFEVGPKKPPQKVLVRIL